MNLLTKENLKLEYDFFLKGASDPKHGLVLGRGFGSDISREKVLGQKLPVPV